MKRLLRIFKWMTGEGLIPSGIFESLRCVASLQRGRTEAKEAPKILPVDEKILKATLPQMTQVLRNMVEFQLLVGCRPGEVCSIKPCMVVRSGDVWTISRSVWMHRSVCLASLQSIQTLSPKTIACFYLRALGSFRELQSAWNRIPHRQTSALESS